MVSALWVLAVALLSSGSVLNPYISEQIFTLDDDGQPEQLAYGTERYQKVIADEIAGFYQRVSFKDYAPDVYFYAPNIVRVPFRGKTYTAMATTENLEPAGRAGLIATLADYIVSQDATEDKASVVAELGEELPLRVVPAWVTKEAGVLVKDYAVQLRARAVDDARQRNLVTALSSTLVPPAVLLAIGLGLGWVLSGFQRRA
jgi:hypothetical protein